MLSRKTNDRRRESKRDIVEKRMSGMKRRSFIGCLISAVAVGFTGIKKAVKEKYNREELFYYYPAEAARLERRIQEQMMDQPRQLRISGATLHGKHLWVNWEVYDG